MSISITDSAGTVAEAGTNSVRHRIRDLALLGVLGLACVGLVTALGARAFAVVVLGLAVVAVFHFRLFALAATALIPLQTVGVGLGAMTLRPSHVTILLYVLYVLTLRHLRISTAAIRLPGRRALTALLIYATLSLAWSPDPGAGAVYLSKLAVALALAVAVLMDPRPAGRVTRELAWGIAFSIAIIVVLQALVVLRSGVAVLEMVRPGAFLTTGGAALQQVGILINPTFAGGRNLLAAWLSVGLFALLFLFWSPGATGPRSRRLIILALLAVTVVSLIATLSRTNWIASAIGVATFLALSSVRGKLQGVGLVFLVLAGLLWLNYLGYAGFLWSRFAALATAQDVGVSGRLELWRAGLSGVASQPLLGLGAGAGIAIARTVSSGWIEVDNLHNVYLQYLTDFGLLGLTLLLVFAGGTTLWGIKVTRRYAGAMRSRGAVAVAMLAALWVRSLGQGQLNDLESWLVLGFSLLLIRSLDPQRASGSSDHGE